MTNRESDWMSEWHDWIMIKVAGKQTVSTSDWMKGYLLEQWGVDSQSKIYFYGKLFVPFETMFCLQ